MSSVNSDSDHEHKYENEYQNENEYQDENEHQDDNGHKDEQQSNNGCQDEKKNQHKRKPGRPCKQVKKPLMPRNGITKFPTNPEHFIEMVYDKPMILKKIFQFFKQLATTKVQIIFKPTEIILYCVDHLEKSMVYVKLDAKRLNHYYCQEELDVGMSCKDIELIFNTIDKEYTSIVILSNQATMQRNIMFVLENDIQADETHIVDLISQYSRCKENEFLDIDYMIKFKFSGHVFKKTINDIKTMSNQLSIRQEDEGHNLLFEYFTKNKKTHSQHKFKNSSKIQLDSKLKRGDSFRVDIKIDYIKPISSAQIADEINILVDENKKFMTISIIDDIAEIKTLTEIIDERTI